MEKERIFGIGYPICEKFKIFIIFKFYSLMKTTRLINFGQMMVFNNTITLIIILMLTFTARES